MKARLQAKRSLLGVAGCIVQTVRSRLCGKSMVRRSSRKAIRSGHADFLPPNVGSIASQSEAPHNWNQGSKYPKLDTESKHMGSEAECHADSLAPRESGGTKKPPRLVRPERNSGPFLSLSLFLQG